MICVILTAVQLGTRLISRKLVATNKMAPVTRRKETFDVENTQKHVDLQIWKVEKKTCSMEHITLHLLHLQVYAKPIIYMMLG